jgi:retron-type reverse transcriptase
MIEKVLNRKNLYKAYRKVVQNKGSAGVDGMEVSDLFSYMENCTNVEKACHRAPRSVPY